MIRMLFADLGSLFAGRLWRRTLHLIVFAALGVGIFAFITSSSLSDAEYAGRVAKVEDARQDFELRMAECGLSPDRSSCAGLIPPNASADPRLHVSEMLDQVSVVGCLAALMAWILATTLVGKSFVNRSIITMLTFEPRRNRLFAGRALSVSVFSGVVCVVAVIAAAVALLPAVLLHGTSPALLADVLAPVGAIGLRACFLALVAAGLGLAMGFLTRSAYTALGLGFLYFGFFENLLRVASPSARRWLILNNGVTLVTGDYFDGQERSPVGSGAFLFVLAVGLLLVAIFDFRSRDLA